MLESEANISNKELRREKIRERYKGSNSELLEVIPGKKAADFYDDVERRVAVYVRVSTDNLQQTSSYELQKNYYEEKVSKNPNWTLVGIYADEGISGTSLLHREAFNRMIEDCKAGKIDMIITKSVSRFARNIVDCISIVRQLSSLKNPVGVRFETEGIFTLNDNTEMSLSFTATIAQEESHIKSSIMNSSIEMRFGRGIVLTPVLLGYDHDEDGKLTINEKEAKTVRLIFFMYLYGYSCQEIAKSLTELGRQTKKGNTTWNAGSVLEILRNERHCGEILTRKTYTPSYLDHKSKKNRGERAQHRWKGDHEPIISKDDFIAVQHLINNAKYGNKGILPELKVIPEGALNVVSISKLSEKEIINMAEYLLQEQPNFKSFSGSRKILSKANNEKNDDAVPAKSPSIKDMPQYDPDSEVASLALTIPSWISSMKRVSNASDMSKVSDNAKARLRNELDRLGNAIFDMFDVLKEEK